MPNTKRALISLSDKKGLLPFAQSLLDLGFELLSTGGTAQLLANAGFSVTEVASYTGFPEILDGRVKTLHPKIHGGILARRDVPSHVIALKEHEISSIDLVCVNLYPFAETIAKDDCTLENAIENIDIGGPAMIRSAAKNWQHVAIVTDNSDFERVVREWQTAGDLSTTTRFELATKAFAHTANYDAMIASYLNGRAGSLIQASGAGSTSHQGSKTSGASPLFPPRLTLQFVKSLDLRYGENPHQQAAFYHDINPPTGSLAHHRQLQGRELSYNNIADADAAWAMVKTFEEASAVIVKHANPCGVASAHDVLSAYRLAFATDPTSAFGGIIALNREVDGATAQALSAQFAEVIIAPKFSVEAKAILANKKNVRVLEIELEYEHNAFEFKRVGGGLLVQTPDTHVLNMHEAQVVSKRAPTQNEWDDLLFTWNVARFVKSNAIVFARGKQTLGVGAGQMSRVDSSRIAAEKAAAAGLDLRGAVAASDAFFPFRDGVDIIAKQGVSAIIHPGGSIRDEEVIEAANEHGLAMVFTHVRHFKH